MILIEDILVSQELFKNNFKCKLDSCRGACCWEGDYGAPLEDQEIENIQGSLDKVLPLLPAKSQSLIKKDGVWVNYKNGSFKGTPLLEDGACAFLSLNSEGIAQCSIEKAYEDKTIDFQKPISCHLYPVRVNKDEHTNFEALNYDVWDICSAACKYGDEEKIPVFRFTKKAIIRKYGQKFYNIMEEIYKDIQEELL